MDDKKLLDIYTDYLISLFGLTTGTGLARLLGGAISHDRIQRFLASPTRNGKDLWQVVKPYVRRIQAEDGVRIGDDRITEKPYTAENDRIAWHDGHTKGHRVKGINCITARYQVDDISLPVNYHLVHKTEYYTDPKTDKLKRRSPVTKNEVYRQLVRQCVQNKLLFRYVLNDPWFASVDNMKLVKTELKRDFIMPIKTNRKLALSLADKKQGHYGRVDTLDLEPDTCLTIYSEGLDFPLLLVKQIFTNADGSVGILYLVTSDVDLTYDQITTIYGERWHVELYHKSLKQNASLSKSPTKTVPTQSNHFFAAVCAFIKLEMLKCATQANHFALKSRLYTQALRTAFDTFHELNPISFSA